MGWISIGLLIISGGCILYKHPPPSILQQFFARCIPRRENSPQPSAPLEEKLTLIIDDENGSAAGSSAPAIPPQSALAASPPPPKDNGRSEPEIAYTAPKSSNHMPPPPRPSNNNPPRPSPPTGPSLSVPRTTLPSSAAIARSRLTPTPPKDSRKVTLAPGHSPLDWAALASNPNNRLRGKDATSEALIRVPPSRLQHQNGRRGRDAWTVYQGKVYNITSYLPFHPGGQGELMRGAGRDAAKLFMEVHPWVNWEGILGECLVGILVSESEDPASGRVNGANQLEEMD